MALVVSLPLVSSAQYSTFFFEGFENNENNLPPGWINAMVIGDETWKIDKGAGPFPAGQVGLPDTAAAGQKNAYFRVPSFNTYVSRLITPPINLEFAVHPELRFWHAQVPRDGINAKLGVYISTSLGGPWTLIASYQNPVNQWTQRALQLPGGIQQLYIAFEGHSGQGLGGSVCIDEVTIVETGTLPRGLTAVASYQPTTFLVHTGSQNNPVLKTELRVEGNTGNLILESFRVVSLSTSDSDIPPSGVKLWFTSSENFLNPVQLGTAQSLSNGETFFTNLNHSLNTGYSYLWVTFDIAEDATPGNYVDAKLPAGGITVNGELFPVSEQNPIGSRQIFQTIFYDDFEQDKGWMLTGEWQRATPMGLGGLIQGQAGTSGPAGADHAVSGTHVLGTDLTGLGSYPGNYEPMLPPLAYVATSPAINTTYYNDIRLSFQRWLNVHLFDRASIDLSLDEGQTWTTIWENLQVQNTSSWSQVSYYVPLANRQSSVMFRFTLGETGGINLQSGWNIDNLVVTGNFLDSDVGVSSLVAPRNTCNLSSQEEITVMVTNFGAAPSPGIIPLAFSIDNGQTWYRDTLRMSIPVGESHIFTFGPKADFSATGLYESVFIRTELPGDKDPENDQLHTSVFSVPVLDIPYAQNFEGGTSDWVAYGEKNSFLLAAPNATYIHEAASGSFAWVTNPFGNYNTGEFSWVESPCFDLSEVEHPVLDFYLNLHVPNGLAGAALDYSIDGGLTWERLEARNDSLAWFWYNNNNITGLAEKTGNCRGWSGISGGWINPRVVLPEILARQPAVRFRIIFAAQNVPLDFEGVAFDMFEIYPVNHDVGITAFVEPETSCMLSDQQQVTVTIGNLGISTIEAGTIIPVGLDFHDENIQLLEEVVLTHELPPGSEINHTFSATFDLSKPGTYNFTTYTKLEGDSDFFTPGVYNDTLSVEVEVFGLPVVDLGEDIYTTDPLNVVLDAGSGHAGYLWQDGSTNQTFQITNPNPQKYWVTVADENNCTATDTINVITYDIAITAVVAPLSGCQAPEGEQVKVEITNMGPGIAEEGLEIPLRLYFQNEWLENGTWQLSQNLNPGQSKVVQFQSIVNLSSDGNFDIQVVHKVRDANPDNDSLHVTIISMGYPLVSLGDSIYTTQPDTLVLDPGAGYASFLWQDGSTNQTFQVTSPHTSTYWVTVFDNQGCNATASVVVATFDAGITGIVSPMNACGLDTNEAVTLIIENFGVDPFDTGTSFGLNLYLDGILEASETLTLTSPLDPGQTVPYTFSQTLDLSEPDLYTLRAEITKRDANPENNQAAAEVIVFGFPQLEIPAMVVTNQPDTVILDAGPGHTSYLWNNGHTEQTLPISSWGTYTVEVSNDFGCLTVGDILVTPEFMDLAINTLVSPSHGCEYDFVNAPVVVSIANAGNVMIPQGEQLTIFFRANGTEEQSQLVTTEMNLLPGQTHQFTFNQPLTIEKVSQVNFELWIEHPGDENPTNDSLDVVVNVFPLPQPYLGDTIIDPNPVGLVLKTAETYPAYFWNDGSTGAELVITSPYSQIYHVTVTDHNGCSNTDSVMVIAWDFEVYDLLSPHSNCTLSASEQVVMVMRNNGPDTFQAGQQFKIGFRVNEQEFTYQNFTLSSSMAPGQFRTFAFAQGANMQGQGPFNLQVHIDLVDVNPGNNLYSREIDAPGLPLIDLGPDIYTTRPDTVILDAGPGFVAYLWQDESTDRFYHVNNFGWHYVRVTDHFGCHNSDTLYIGQSSGLARNGIPGTEVSIFPNPARDQVTIRIQQEGSQTFHLELLTHTGSRLFTRMLLPEAITEEEINLSNLHEGVYYIRLSSNLGVMTKKLIVTGPTNR